MMTCNDAYEVKTALEWAWIRVMSDSTSYDPVMALYWRFGMALLLLVYS